MKSQSGESSSSFYKMCESPSYYLGKKVIEQNASFQQSTSKRGNIVTSVNILIENESVDYNGGKIGKRGQLFKN